MQRVVLFVIIAVLAVHLQCGFGQDSDIDVDKVLCTDQQEACNCREDANVCQFRLEVEELQTFVSYRIGVDGELITRGTPGDSYFVGQNGYQASLFNETCDRSRMDRPPECGTCWTGRTFTNEQTFKDMSCSIPMTVDGHTYRLYIAVNGRIPGPTLIVTENQTVQVDVINQLTSEGVTIHWHGMHQRRTPWMDGVASLSQIPIVPGGSFRYIFKATPAGTHWYHSHLGAQRTDGLFGGLIVRERNVMQQRAVDAIGLGPFLDIPEQHTLTLIDWQRESSLSLFVQIHSTLGFYPNKPLGEVPRGDRDQLYMPRTVSTDGIEVGPVPYWSGLINGRGRYDRSTYSILSTFSVTPGMAYRFRLIGAQSLYAYSFEIEGHQLTVVATDGHFIQPQRVDYIIIHTGERYDFILNATEPVNNYLIRATTLERSISPLDTRNPGIHTAEAILHYVGATYPDPRNLYNDIAAIPTRCSDSNRCIALNCPFRLYPPSQFISCIVIDELRSLFPSDESDLPKLDVSEEDRLKFFNFGFEGQSFTSAINGRNFLPPPTPYQVYRGQYDDDLKDESVNTCGECNQMTTSSTQPEQCTCIHVEKIVTKENPDNTNSDKSVVMVLSAVGNVTSRLRDFSHPVHLHGHSFYVVKVGHGTYNESSGLLMDNSNDIACESTLCMKPTWRDNMPDFNDYITLSNKKLNNTAIRKDTVIVPAGGYVVIAFQADNPGYWFLHCHIEVHQLEGMALIIQEYGENWHNYVLPENITKVGNFKWSIDEFNRAVMDPSDAASIILPVPFLYTLSMLLNVIVLGLVLS